MHCPATTLASLILCYSYFLTGRRPPPANITVPSAPSSPFPFLKTTFPRPGERGLFDRPRTLLDAENEGWTQISSCRDKDVQ